MVGGIETTIDDIPGIVGPSDGIGAFGQPVWVQNSSFATTRVHIQRNPGEFAVEQWWRGRLDDGNWKHRFQEELEIGLPWRMQLDLYADWTYQDGEADFLDFAAEIRYGLADWGGLPGNPALYFEYKFACAGRRPAQRPACAGAGSNAGAE